MRFNEDIESGSKSDDDKHGDKIEEYDIGVEYSTVEDIAEETPLFMEAVEASQKKQRSAPDFSDDPGSPSSPSYPGAPSYEAPTYDPPSYEAPSYEAPDYGDITNPFEDFEFEAPSFDLGDLDIGNIDLSSTVGLLQAQLQMMNIMTDLLLRVASQGQSLLPMMQDVQRVERANYEVNRRVLQNSMPFQVATVSGINDTSVPGSPEVVVPESDEIQIPTRQLMIKASRSNNEKIWFGDDDTSPNSGFSLSPGEGTTIEVDLREQQLYMSSVEENQVVELLGVV